MGSTVILASGLTDGYDNTIGAFFGSGGGKVVANVMAGIAAVLLVVLIVALIMKALGRQNQLVQTMAPGAGRIVAILLAIFVLAGPVVTLPILVKVFDLIASGLGNAGTDLIQK